MTHARPETCALLELVRKAHPGKQKFVLSLWTSSYRNHGISWHVQRVNHTVPTVARHEQSVDRHTQCGKESTRVCRVHLRSYCVGRREEDSAGYEFGVFPRTVQHSGCQCIAMPHHGHGPSTRSFKPSGGCVDKKIKQKYYNNIIYNYYNPNNYSQV